jgi:4-amino-4-deoxy-L-arabinose transferase-like glycosyltransferase
VYHKNISIFLSEYRQNKFIYVLLFVFLVWGIFLRTYHWSELMHFELDQARDVFVVYDAVEQGIDHLPLLGPQARGRELYLGPIFYYFQYGSALIFGVSPESVALPDLIFSILSIPLFYLFARLFFDRKVSVALTGLIALSPFLVIYGRFAWNPNSMFFWSLVTFYALIRSCSDDDFRPQWFFASIVGLAILMQLHFIAFIAAPLIFIAYVILMVLSRAKIPLRTICVSVLLFVLLYAPVIVYDVKNHGQNARAFIASITMSPEAGADANTAGDRRHDLIEKTFRFVQESSTYYWHILTGDHHGRYHIRTKKSEQGYFPLICDERCRTALPYHALAICLTIVSCGFFFYRIRAIFRATRRERGNEQKIYQRNIYVLITLWLLCGSVFLIMVAYQISPRFYLFLAAPFYIMLGVILGAISTTRKIGKSVFLCVVSALMIVNIYAIVQYFALLHRASVDALEVQWRDLTLNRPDIVTLGQLRESAAYISQNGDGAHVVIVGDNRYARAVYYLSSIEDQNKNVSCYVKRSGFRPERLRGVSYFLLVRESSREHINEEMHAQHTAVDQQNFGTITVYKMLPRETLPEENDTIDGCFVR